MGLTDHKTLKGGRCEYISIMEEVFSLCARRLSYQSICDGFSFVKLNLQLEGEIHRFHMHTNTKNVLWVSNLKK